MTSTHRPARIGKGRLLALIVAALVLEALALTAASAAQAATFPGTNGNIAYSRFDSDTNYDIWVMRPDGSGHAQLTDDDAIDRGPGWSPDGSKIAFESERTGGGDIYVMSADGPNETRLTSYGGEESSPTYSPDGSRIAFRRSDIETGDESIWVINADGSGTPQQLSNGDDDYGPEWSPDGTKIAYINYDGGDDIWVMDADGSNERELSENGRAPIWSPDGTKIAYFAFVSGPVERGALQSNSNEIFTMNSADGSGKKQLTDHEADDRGPGWSPDGTKISFRSNRSGDPEDQEIWVMGADGSSPTQLTHDGSQKGGISRWQTIRAAVPQPVFGPPPPVARDTARPRVRIAGLRRACVSRNFRVRFRLDEQPRRVHVFLDGRRIARSTRTQFAVRVPARRLRSGRHRLLVIARDLAGNRTRVRRRFTRCARKAQVRRAPSFTG